MRYARILLVALIYLRRWHFSGDEPKHELIIERVPGGRRAALVVSVVAVLIVGTLVWKPWDTGAPAATPPASLALVAAATPSASPSSSIAPGPSPGETPGTATSPDSPSLIFPSETGLGNVMFTTSDGPEVHCLYKSDPLTSRNGLASMIVDAPLVFPGNHSSAKVGWRVEVESNTQDKIFEAEWQPVSRSKTVRVKFDGTPATFEPMFVKVRRADPITIFRVIIDVDWLDRHGNVLEAQQIHPTVYGPMGNANGPLGPGGCAAVATAN